MALAPEPPIDAAASGGARLGPLGGLRIQGRLLAILLTLLACLLPHYACRLATRHSPMPRLFLRALARILGARVRVIGTPLRRDVIFLGNHLSWLDIPVLAGASGTAFVAKAEVAAIPVIGWLARLNHTVFVKREARVGVAERINELREALAGNRAVAVFPEGTTTDGRSLLPFKTALLKVLEPPLPGVMVQPVLLDYGALGPELCWIGEEPGLANVLRVLGRRGSFPLVVRFLEPFAPDGTGGRKAIAAQARARIEAALTQALGHAPRPFGQEVAAVGYAPASRQVAASEAHDRAEGED